MIYVGANRTKWVIVKAEVIADDFDVTIRCHIRQPTERPEDKRIYTVNFGVKGWDEETPAGVIASSINVHITSRDYIRRKMQPLCCDMDKLIPWFESQGLLIEAEQALSRVVPT